MSTLERILISPEDMKDLRDVQPFVLTTSEIPLYDIRYLGPQKADEIIEGTLRHIDEADIVFDIRLDRMNIKPYWTCHNFKVLPQSILPG